jgi:hypothetical protein
MGDAVGRPIDAGRFVLDAVEVGVKQAPAGVHHDHHLVSMIMAVASSHHLQHGNGTVRPVIRGLIRAQHRDAASGKIELGAAGGADDPNGMLSP